MGLTFYIGFMGCGKSTLGRLHAAEQGKRFVDLDAVFLQETGKTPAIYLTHKGEPAFRKEEQKVLHKTVAQWMADGRPAQIIACGGGTPCFFDNLQFMKEHGHVVFIDTPLATILDRLMRQPERWPLAQKQAPQILYKERRKWYEQAHERLVP
ncbi:MAG: shikimate kinase [Bacteroidales bacterium]|nr:shikimate kinase [Bacteroidales bacterium]